jgi:DNA-directed RNA polymerase specialized sigma24 family protein
MSWFHASTAPVDARNHASAAEIVACFQDQRHLLRKLALLITGDQVTAEQATVEACEVTLRGNSPFRDWLFEWAKAATITSAISQRAAAIRLCGAGYKDWSCNHAEHLLQGNAEERLASLDRILQADGQELVMELDPLCRAILVLRVAIRSSIQDCVIRLNVSRAAVLAANCRAMTWLHDCQTTPVKDIMTLQSPSDNKGTGCGLDTKRTFQIE